jgi:ATP-dependent Lon protease
MGALYDALPNFTDALDDVKRHVALSQDSSDGLEVTPMLLLGPPGIGKTHFARQAGGPAGHRHEFGAHELHDGGLVAVGLVLTMERRRPGKVFEALVDGQYANPVIVVDEVDKASATRSTTRWARSTACSNTTARKTLWTSLPKWRSTPAR